MLILVRIISILIIFIGIIFLLNPKLLKRVISFYAQGKKLYIIAILRFVIGIILLLTASQCKLVGVVITLGILFLIGGVIIFAFRLEKLKSILNWWKERPTMVLHLKSLIPLGIGALLLYSA